MGWTPEYWRKHGERIAAERKARYHNDPEYREKARERSRAYRARKKAEREAQLSKPTITVGGKVVPALTSDTLCEKAGINKARLKYMQRTGYLPNALITHPVRLYTNRQAQLVKNLEALLRTSSHHLRTPQTEKGAKAKAKLDALVSTIHAQWET